MTNFIAGLVTANNQFWFERPVFDDTLDDGLLYDHELVVGDNVLAELMSGSQKDRWHQMYDFVMYTHADQRRFLDFFCTGTFARMGRVRSFWFPSWINDFDLASDVTSGASTDIFVQQCGFEKSFEANRFGIQILKKNGDKIINKLHAYDATVNPNKLTVIGGLGTTCLVSDVALFSIVRRVRFDVSDWAFDYDTDAHARLRVPVIECPLEGQFA